MGIVIGIVIDVAVSAASAVVEAAATAAAEAAAAAAEVAGEAATEGVEEAATAAAEAAADAAAEVAGEAATEGVEEAAAESAAESAAEGAGEAASIGVKILKAIAKLNKFIKEFFAIDAIFKTANGIMRAIEGSSPKVKKLENYVNVLVEMETKMTTIGNWLEKHKKDTVKLEGIDFRVDSGILGDFMSPLAAGSGNLKRIANDVAQQNKVKSPITDAQLDSIQKCLIKVNMAFDSLATFIDDKKGKVKILASFPISKDEVKSWHKQLQN